MSLKENLKQFIIEAADGNVAMEDLDRVGDTIKNLGLDSLAKIRVVVQIEEEYNLEIDVEEVRAEVFDSLALLAEYVEERLNKLITS